MKESSSSSSIRLGGAVISDRVVAALLEELRTGRYADADRLPAEVDLAAELGVSRTVIRDALRHWHSGQPHRAWPAQPP